MLASHNYWHWALYFMEKVRSFPVAGSSGLWKLRSSFLPGHLKPGVDYIKINLSLQLCNTIYKECLFLCCEGAGIHLCSVSPHRASTRALCRSTTRRCVHA